MSDPRGITIIAMMNMEKEVEELNLLFKKYFVKLEDGPLYKNILLLKEMNGLLLMIYILYLFSNILNIIYHYIN